MIARELILGNINRPEYVSYSEIFISDLCWNYYEVPGWEENDRARGPRSLGLIYDSCGDGSPRTVDLRSTRPDRESLSTWAAALRDAGLLVEGHQAEVSAAIADALLGIKSKNARRRPATPITPAVALLQNKVGIAAKRGPANIAVILEKMYRLGAPSGVPLAQSSASSRLVKAMERRIETDSMLRTIDVAVRESLLPARAVPVSRAVSGALDSSEMSAGIGHETPFSWFRRNWDRLTSDAWIENLPPRRWTDWLTTVARTAFGFGYLWEMRWYEAIARRIVAIAEGADPTDSEMRIWDAMDLRPVIEWESHKSSVSRRDVTSEMKASIQVGLAVRQVLLELLDGDLVGDTETVDEFIVRIAGTPSLVSKFEASLSRQTANSGPEKNHWEAVRFALGVREKSGQFADHYGFLQKVGTKFLIVEPATEWVAVVASLACSETGWRATLGQVKRELQSLGLDPSVPELLTQLERAGLARSSPDADDGVYVEAAFHE